MSDFKTLVENYRTCYKTWRELVDKERDIRQDIIDEHDGKEPDDLRALLDEEVEDSGLRESQQEALAALKESERAIFLFNFEHVTDPELLRELEHLSQDYAARITWLQQYLEPLEALGEQAEAEDEE